ncbi:hypothetical protein JZO70_14255 [Enterococcus sp. 669A]|uniref:Uncharacterized protein n=1 Tax=Candidatus Enterococcus moelleringii TaxID=2815325 RepID=A0ABS3LCH7_9ENTE|nr:hypothetical protein [Enterococcus sp. 669A]MBO1307337.1 hypothetical protein [Enterococcus sp. 669A]
MNKEAIIVGENYECRKADFERPIIGEVLQKTDEGCIVNVERFYGLDADKINENDGKVLIRYSEVRGIISSQCFFS